MVALSAADLDRINSTLEPAGDVHAGYLAGTSFSNIHYLAQIREQLLQEKLKH